MKKLMEAISRILIILAVLGCLSVIFNFGSDSSSGGSSSGSFLPGEDSSDTPTIELDKKEIYF